MKYFIKDSSGKAHGPFDSSWVRKNCRSDTLICQLEDYPKNWRRACEFEEFSDVVPAVKSQSSFQEKKLGEKQGSGIFPLIMMVLGFFLIIGGVNFLVKNSDGLNSSNPYNNSQSKSINTDENDASRNETNEQEIFPLDASPEPIEVGGDEDGDGKNDVEQFNRGFHDISEKEKLKENNKKIICPNCKGTREMTKNCPDCRGTGYDNHNDHKCYFCQGLGTKVVNCTTCNGAGRVFEYE